LAELFLRLFFDPCNKVAAIVRSRGFQDDQYGHGAAEELQSAAVGGDVLVVTGSRTEVVAQLVVSSTEPGGRSGAFETAHGPISALQAAVILFQSIVSMAAGVVAHLLARL
jgi:hypothetical protein